MYKDKDKQREAVRLAVRRHRTKVLHERSVIPEECNTPDEIPERKPITFNTVEPWKMVIPPCPAGESQSEWNFKHRHLVEN